MIINIKVTIKSLAEGPVKNLECIFLFWRNYWCTLDMRLPKQLYISNRKTLFKLSEGEIYHKTNDCYLFY